MTSLLARVRERDRDRCVACGCAGSHGFHLEVHHIVYRSQGGPDNPLNLVTLCGDCHRSAHGGRSDRLRGEELQWMVWEGRPGRFRARRALSAGKCLGCEWAGPGTTDPAIRALSQEVFCEVLGTRVSYDFSCEEFEPKAFLNGKSKPA